MRRLLAVVAMLTLGACGGGSGSILEGGARVPDQEGIVVDVSFERLVLDGDRVYRIHPEVESFTTRSHEPASLLSWQDRYVHIGLDGDDRVIWVAGIGAVHATEGVVLYTGVLERIDGEGRLVFEEGTVLRAADGLELPAGGEEVLVRLDPERQEVVDVRVQ